MRYFIFTILFVLSCLLNGFAQNIQGKVLSAEKEALGGANVYVREIRQGTVTNDKGEFQLSLPPGNYTLEISYLGFEKKILEIRAADKPSAIIIELMPTAIMLPVIRVSNKKEDAAYDIMRQAIARAPYHRNQVERYMAEVYTRGRGKVDKIPKAYLLGLSADERKEVNALIGKLMVLESVVNVNFRAPDNYNSEVVAFTSTLPEEIDTQAAFGIITASVYDPIILGLMSPLAPGAFSQYKFHLMESYYQDDKMISKIKVEPKKKNAPLFAGELFIEEEGFSVVAFNITANIYNTDMHFKATYHEVAPEVYLPTSYDITANVKLLGVKAQARYLASLKYKDIIASSPARIIEPQQVVKKEDVNLSDKQKKSLDKLEELSQKEFVSTREAYKMAKLTQDIMDETRLSDSIQPNEINPLGVSIKSVKNSDVIVRDTAIWAEVRTIPLDEEEMASYSVPLTFPTIVGDDGKSSPPQKNKVSAAGLIFGDRFIFERVRVRYDGLVFVVPEYNFVDGFWIGQGFNIGIDVNSYRRLMVNPSFYYTTARKTLVWDLEVLSPSIKRFNGLLTVKAGDKTMDFKQSEGSLRLENALTSLIDGYNYMNFYRSRYVEVHSRTDIYKGLRFELSGVYQKRNVLSNNTTYNFFGNKVNENIPVSNNRLMYMPDNESAKLKAYLFYSPQRRINQNRHSYFKKIEWPSVFASYEWGIPVSSGATSNFHKIELGLSQSFSPSFFSNLSWDVQAGKFFSVKEIYFPDYKHFGTSGWWINTDGFRTNFFMDDYYNFATADKWIYAGVNFRSSYLAIKNLPFLQKYLFDESLHLRYLWIPEQKNYLELGYSLGMKNFWRLGVFVNFKQMDFEAVSFRMYLPLELIIKL